MRNNTLWGLLALSLVSMNAAAEAADDSSGGLIAYQPDDWAFERPLELDRADLEARFPTVARALGQVGVYTEPADHEKESVRAFFQELDGFDGLRIDGEDFLVVAAMAAGGPAPPPGEVTTLGDEPPSGQAPSLLGTSLLALLGLAAIVLRQRA